MNRKQLMPEPGDYETPLMTEVTVLSLAQDNGALRLEFRTSEERNPAIRMTIQVPIPALEASGILRSLKMLQDAGRIPYVPESNSSQH